MICNNKPDNSVEPNNNNSTISNETYPILFEKNTIQDVYISMDEDNYNKLLENAKRKEYVPINEFKLNDYTIEKKNHWKK